MLVVAMLAVPGARAQTPESPTLSLPNSKLDLPIFTPTVMTKSMPEPAYYRDGFGVEFGGPSSGWRLFGSVATAGLFSLAVINAFIPRWLPKGMGRTLNLNGTGGRSPSDVGVDDYGMGYSEHY